MQIHTRETVCSQCPPGFAQGAATDLVTRRIRLPYTPVTILATDDTVLRDCAWAARGPERHAAGAARCSA